MLYNILKISLIFGVASVALAASIDSQEYVRVGDKFYYFSNDTHNWFEAQSKCWLLAGFLATLEGPSDQRIISEYMVKNLPNDRYWWIYATDLNKFGNFRGLENGGSANNGTWAPGQPDNYEANEHCVHLKYSYNDLKRYEMNDWDCEQKANYICESLVLYDDNFADSPKIVLLDTF